MTKGLQGTLLNVSRDKEVNCYSPSWFTVIKISFCRNHSGFSHLLLLLRAHRQNVLLFCFSKGKNFSLGKGWKNFLVILTNRLLSRKGMIRPLRSSISDLVETTLFNWHQSLYLTHSKMKQNKMVLCIDQLWEGRMHDFIRIVTNRGEQWSWDRAGLQGSTLEGCPLTPGSVTTAACRC